MFSWNELWSIVLIFTVSPLFAFWKASITDWTAALGVASDWLEPRLTVPVAGAVPPPLLPDGLLLLHEASSGGAARRAPAPRAPRRTDRRDTPAAEEGTMRARYSASVEGRAMTRLLRR